MQPHALSISMIDKSWYGMSQEERIRRLDAIEAAHKDTPPNTWEERPAESRTCPWPEWMITLVKSVCKRMQWDWENGEFKSSFKSEPLAEDAAQALRAAIGKYVQAVEHAEEKKWYDQQKFAIRVRPITKEYAEADLELAESLREVDDEEV